MKQKQIFYLWLPALLLAIAFFSCSRYGDDVTISETDIVSTIRDEGTNFSGLTKTYAIVDKINIADDPDNEIDSIQFWAIWNAPVLNAINSNLSSLGYTKVDVSANPSLFINVTVNANVTSGSVWYPGWWWGYYPCSPYYYWWCYGGWYPGGAYYYEFTEGSMVIEMVDINRSMENERPTIVWLAALTKVLSDNSSTNVQAVVKDIDQAFKQSPYLR